jgi:hypothetical protein
MHNVVMAGASLSADGESRDGTADEVVPVVEAGHLVPLRPEYGPTFGNRVGTVDSRSLTE